MEIPALIDLFVYGTLQSGPLLNAVSGRADLVSQSANLQGYSVGTVAGDVVPFVRIDPDGMCQGALIRSLDGDALRRLDAYESAFGYTRVDVSVTVDGARVAAKMYLPPQDVPDAQKPWSLHDWLENWETTAVFAATELFRLDPPLSPAQIRSQWGQIQGRAWAKTLAQSDTGPATLRRSDAADHVDMTYCAPPKGAFYRFEQAKIVSRQFDGTLSSGLLREGFVGFDAALVLPYDPVRDRVMLVEQIRVGPLLRGDPGPWLLEPIAGMVDPREAPADAARREAQEEAGLTQLDLHPVARVYASPGGSTDFFHMYVGVCDLPDDHPRHGGLETEGEDIRLHILPRGEVMELVRSGEVNVGPLLSLVLWLELNHQTLQ